MIGESHESKLDTLEDGMDPNSDVGATQPGRHEAKLRVLGDDATTDGNLEHICGRLREAEYDPPKQDEEIADDFRPMQLEASSDPLRNPKDANEDYEPMSYETDLGALEDDEIFGSGGSDEADSGAVGLDGETNGSDIEDMHFEQSKPENGISEDHEDQCGDIDSIPSEGDIAEPGRYELEEQGIIAVRHKRWYRERYHKHRINERLFD